MRKMLLLGGSVSQIPLINKAKKMGYYVITCDYLPDNPGHKLADEYYNVSTTDMEKVLEVSLRNKIDGIVCFASDPAAPTAAYVSEKMSFPTSPYKSVELLTHKDQFRDFLRDNGFMTPKAVSFGEDEIEDAIAQSHCFELPYLIKPVDSSGSKGISVVREEKDLRKIIQRALSYSRCKRFLIEEYVEKAGYQIAGDGFSVDGDLVFYCFANDHFDMSIDGKYIPVGESFPYIGGRDKDIHLEIQRVLKLLEMKTQAYNFEARIDSKGRIFLMEIGPRSGGNAIPQATCYATGVDMIDYVIKSAMGEDCSDLRMVEPKGYWGTYMLHTPVGGEFCGIEMNEQFEKNNLVQMTINYDIGEITERFTGADKAVGTLILKFSSEDEMLTKMDNMTEYVKVNTKVQ